MLRRLAALGVATVLVTASATAQERPCPSDAVVLLAIGQSNAANNAPTLNDPRDERVLNFHRGRCYLARDPLLGATGRGGSVWTVVARRLAADGRPVVIVPLARGRTTVAEWAHDLPSQRLAQALNDLRRARLVPTLVLWHQGETDARNGTTADQYAADFGRVVQHLRDGGVAAPLVVATASRCGRSSSPDVRAAQQRLPELYAGVVAGPDTDTLGMAMRPDGCHLVAEPHADLWEPIIRRLLDSARR